MINKIISCLVLSLSFLWLAKSEAQSASIDCLHEETALNYWRPIRASIDDESHEPNQLATELVSCLGSPNSELRDTIGYELFTYWLRNDVLSSQTKANLINTLSANIQLSSSEHALSRSFSALIISELLRADNLSAFMSDEDRLSLLQTSVNSLSAETDFRGLEEDIGWVHPVAHLADILWRVALHSSLDQEQSRLILQGVSSKARTSVVGYAFKEGDRLARSVSVLIVRQSLSSTEFVNWLSSFDSPATMDSWFDVFTSVEGMRELHNSKLFVRALSDQLKDDEIDAAIRTKLDELVATLTQIV
jgi:hypothetical protein